MNDVMITQQLGPDVKHFKAQPIFNEWKDRPFVASANGRGRQLQAVMQKVINPPSLLSSAAD